MNWHYVENGQQAGPVNEAQFQELIRAGKITTDTLVWREGMASWIPYGQTPGAQIAPSVVIGDSPAAVCAECGQMFAVADMIRHGSSYICAGCKPVFMQKLSEGAQLETGELNYAPIGTRFAAIFLDGLILGIVNGIIGFFIGMAGAGTVRGNPGALTVIQLIAFVVGLFFGVTYETFFIGKYGATLGKMACKIKVITADGGRVSYGRAFGRYFGKMLSSFTCLIGYIMAIFDKPERRALHDRICNTRVIMK